MAADTVGGELALDHHLRGDAGVVGARLPERVVAAHAVEAHEGIHDRVVEAVAHVQRAGDIGRRDHDAVRRAGARWLKAAFGFPAFGPAAFDIGGVKSRFHHDLAKN